MPPDGIYRADMTAADLIAAGAEAGIAQSNVGIWTWTWRQGTWTAGRQGDPSGCSGVYHSVDGKSVVFETTNDQGCGMESEIVWRDDGNGLSLILVGSPYDASAQQFANERSLYERSWARVE